MRLGGTRYNVFKVIVVVILSPSIYFIPMNELQVIPPKCRRANETIHSKLLVSLCSTTSFIESNFVLKSSSDYFVRGPSLTNRLKNPSQLCNKTIRTANCTPINIKEVSSHTLLTSTRFKIEFDSKAVAQKRKGYLDSK